MKMPLQAFARHPQQSTSPNVALSGRHSQDAAPKFTPSEGPAASAGERGLLGRFLQRTVSRRRSLMVLAKKPSSPRTADANKEGRTRACIPENPDRDERDRVDLDKVQQLPPATTDTHDKPDSIQQDKSEPPPSTQLPPAATTSNNSWRGSNQQRSPVSPSQDQSAIVPPALSPSSTGRKGDSNPRFSFSSNSQTEVLLTQRPQQLAAPPADTEPAMAKPAAGSGSGSGSGSAPKLRTRRSFRERFWSRSGANSFGGDADESPAKTSASNADLGGNKPSYYVPRHAATDFSRMGATVTSPRSHRHSYSVGDVPRPLSPIKGEDNEETAGEVVFGAQIVRKDPPRLPADEYAARPRVRPMTSAQEPPAGTLEHAIAVTRALEEAQARMQRQQGLDYQRPAHRYTDSNASDAFHGPLTHRISMLDPALTDDDAEREALVQRPFPPQPTYPRQTGAAAAPDPTQQQQRQQQPAAPTIEVDPITDENLDALDFQLFMAQAIVDDRAHRAELWRSLSEQSERNAAQPGIGYGHGHSNYGTNATAALRSPPLSNKRDSAYYSGDKKRASANLTIEEEPGSGGNSNNASRKGNYGNGVVLFPSGRRSAEGSDQDSKQQPKLKRKPSITQKVANYIKPPRPQTSLYDEPPYRPVTARPETRRTKFAESVPE